MEKMHDGHFDASVMSRDLKRECGQHNNLAATVPSDNFTVILVSTTPYQNYDKEEWDMNATPIYIYFFSGS